MINYPNTISLFTFQRKIKSRNQDHARPSLILRGNAVTEAESNLCESALDIVYEIGRRITEEELA